MINLIAICLIAVPVINSWPSLPPSGVFEGTFSDFGAYNQCKDIDEMIGTKSIEAVQVYESRKSMVL